jgi:hypothetical protein
MEEGQRSWREDAFQKPQMDIEKKANLNHNSRDKGAR